MRIVVGRRGLLGQELKERELSGELEWGGGGKTGDDTERGPEGLTASRSRAEWLLGGRGGAKQEFGACGPDNEGVDVGLIVVVDNDGVWLSEETMGDAQSFSLLMVACGLIGRMEVKSREELGAFSDCGERGAK